MVGGCNENANNKKNKTMFRRLTRWLDRLIPLNFEVEHMQVVKIGLAEYQSRHPNNVCLLTLKTGLFKAPSDTKSIFQIVRQV